MNDGPVDFNALRKKLEAEGRIKPLPEPKPEPDYSEYADSIPDIEDTSHSDISDAQKQVNAAVDSLTMMQVYDRLVRGKHGGSGGTDEVLVQCPNDDHPDNNPSASLNTKKELLICYRCEKAGLSPKRGWNKIGLAAQVFGIDNIPENLPLIKRRLAKELRGVDYDALRAADNAADIRQSPDYPAKTEPQSRFPAADARDAGDPDDAELTPYEREVQKREAWLLIDSEARSRVRARQAADSHTEFAIGETLGDLLSKPKREVVWTIDKLHAKGTTTLILGDFKAGKTTMMQNLLRSLADQSHFLGELPVRDLSGNIAYFNFEVDDDEMRDRLEAMNVSKVDRILPVNLRSYKYDLLNATTFEQTVTQLNAREVEVLILDPWARLNQSDDENANTAAGRYTQALDTLKAETGVVDILIPAHSAKGQTLGAELSVRGASTVDGWADYRWMLYAEDGGLKHYFKLGRSRRNDEHLSKLREVFMDSGGLLSLAAASTATASRRDLDKRMLAKLKENFPISKSKLIRAVGAHNNEGYASIDRLENDLELKVIINGRTHECWPYDEAPDPI